MHQGKEKSIIELQYNFNLKNNSAVGENKKMQTVHCKNMKWTGSLLTWLLLLWVLRSTGDKSSKSSLHAMAADDFLGVEYISWIARKTFTYMYVQEETILHFITMRWEVFSSATFNKDLL